MSNAITGYRQLAPNEVELVNEIKLLAEKVGVMVESLKGAGIADERWVEEARTDLQKGFMALVRAITKPTTF